jgi:tRNA(His) 5'-end guanylyltransferase
MMLDERAVRMKEYEAVTRTRLLPHSITILRVDGRSFSEYLRRAIKPFDMDFVRSMQEVGRALCREIPGALIAYGQSDEISLLISDRNPRSDAWFGGSVQKMTSVSASLATTTLICERGTHGRPTFDARVFTLPNWTEAKNYFIWRQRDAVRNSIQMAGQAYFTHRDLLGKDTNAIQEMLFITHGINWNDYPEDVKRGWVLTRQIREAPVTYTDKRSQEEKSTLAMRSFWEVSNPHFSVAYRFPASHPVAEFVDAAISD